MDFNDVDEYLIRKCRKYEDEMGRMIHVYKHTRREKLIFKYLEYKHSTTLLYLYKNLRAQWTKEDVISLEEVKNELSRIKKEQKKDLDNLKVNLPFRKWIFNNMKKSSVYISIIGTIGYFISQIIMIHMFGLIKGLQYNNFPFLLVWMIFFIGDISIVLRYTKYRREMK